jgi:peptide/nickel transport system permease protein
VRAEFLSLREREFVEAARVAGASDARIIFKHILPNAIGVVIVAATLLASAGILLETALSFLQLGVRPPDVSLGLIISDNQSAFQTRPWLFWWPAVFIVLLSLLVNFVGDGLRDAFDPRQKRFSLRRTKEQTPSAPSTAPASVQARVRPETPSS